MASAACHGRGIRTLSFSPPADCSTCRFLDAGGSAGFASRSRLPVPAESCTIQSVSLCTDKAADTLCLAAFEFAPKGPPHYNRARIALMSDFPYWLSGESMSKCPAPSSLSTLTESPLAVAELT